MKHLSVYSPWKKEKEKEMKFEKSLRNEIAETLPEWQGEFISYKELKKLLKNRDGGEEMGFVELLDSELMKINAFFVEKEEECVIRFKELEDRVEDLDGDEDSTQLKIDILDFHGEMVLLMHYSVLNFAGLLKIVKKHNKKRETSIFLPFMPRVLQQPFFTTDLVCQLLRECEEMLNQLL